MKYTEVLLERGSRRQSHMASILGVSRQAVEYFQNNKRECQHSNSYKLIYRILTNATDEFIRYMLDDKNFNAKQQHIHAVNAEAEYKASLPPAPTGTFGKETLAKQLATLKIDDPLYFQHIKTVCGAVKYKLPKIGEYLCGYVYAKKLDDHIAEVIGERFSRNITFIDYLTQCIGFDLAGEGKRGTDLNYFIETLQELIRLVRIYAK